MKLKYSFLLCLLLLSLLGRGIFRNIAVAAADTKIAAPKPTFVLHLPGIGGERSCDHMLVDGLKQGGLNANYQIYDWTGDEQGLVALTNPKRHVDQAEKVAAMIQARFHAHPRERIILTSHSGGAGIAAWALEQLPADVKIDTWVMLAPALSPQFDLSKALSHVKHNAFVFGSTNDTIVLSTGTRLMGTIDRIKCDAAGLGGFEMPDTADAVQYAKLVSVPYESDWMRFDNPGTHIGCMMRPFTRAVLAPTLLDGVLPKTVAAAVPSSQSAMP